MRNRPGPPAAAPWPGVGRWAKPASGERDGGGGEEGVTRLQTEMGTGTSADTLLVVDSRAPVTSSGARYEAATKPSSRPTRWAPYTHRRWCLKWPRVLCNGRSESKWRAPPSPRHVPRRPSGLSGSEYRRTNSGRMRRTKMPRPRKESLGRWAHVHGSSEGSAC
jgi:hypothetical protein